MENYFPNFNQPDYWPDPTSPNSVSGWDGLNWTSGSGLLFVTLVYSEVNKSFEGMFEKIYHDIFHKSFKTDNIFHVYLESLNSNSEIVSKAVFTGCFQQMIIFVFVGLFYKIMSRIHKNIHNTGRMTTIFFSNNSNLTRISEKSTYKRWVEL